MSDADVTIRMGAVDDASTTVDSATKNMNSSFRAMRQEQDAVGRSFLTNNQSLFAMGRAMSATGRVLDRTVSFFNAYNMMQIRITQANTVASDAQEKLSEAISEFGLNSAQAQQASKDYQKSLTDQKKAEEEATAQFTIMTLSMVAQSGTMITTVIPRLGALAVSLGLVSRSATGGIGGITKLGAAVGTVAGVGIAGLGIATGGSDKSFAQKLMSTGETAGGLALTGANIGSIVLPGIGTGIGAAVGGAAGLGLGLYQNFFSGGGQGGGGQQNTFNIQGLNPTDIVAQIQQKLGSLNTFGGQTP